MFGRPRQALADNHAHTPPPSSSDISLLTGAARLKASPLPAGLFTPPSKSENRDDRDRDRDRDRDTLSNSNAPGPGPGPGHSERERSNSGSSDLAILKRPDVQEYIQAVNAQITERLSSAGMWIREYVNMGICEYMNT